jgi:outer membrane immunogenic protein
MLFAKGRTETMGIFMRRLLVGAAVCAAVAAPAAAADMTSPKYTKAPIMTAPQAVYNWTGF